VEVSQGELTRDLAPLGLPSLALGRLSTP